MNYTLNNIERNHCLYEKIKSYLKNNREEILNNSPKRIEYLVGTINPKEDMNKIIISKFEVKLSKKKILGIFGREKLGMLDYVKKKNEEGNISAVISRENLENII